VYHGKQPCLDDSALQEVQAELTKAGISAKLYVFPGAGLRNSRSGLRRKRSIGDHFMFEREQLSGRSELSLLLIGKSDLPNYAAVAAAAIDGALVHPGGYLLIPGCRRNTIGRQWI